MTRARERRDGLRGSAGWGGLTVLLPFVLAGAGATAGCDGGSRTPDARTRAAAESSEVSVRFDVSPGKPASVHVLAFRASVSSLGAPATTTATTAPARDPLAQQLDVLGTVDPLGAASPEQGCLLRDVDLATSALGARGASIELEEMSGIGVGLGEGPGAGTLLRPFPRLYPDVAAVLGGVVTEVGPQPLGTLPDRVSLYTADVELPVAELALPAAPRIATINGAAPAPGARLRLDTQEPLAVTVAGGNGGGGGVLELRPFGATVSVACAIPTSTAPEIIVGVPRPLLARVVEAAAPSGPCPGCVVPASVEVARRARLRQSLGAPTTRISVEVRSAVTVELRP